jgi:hypothetical protein
MSDTEPTIAKLIVRCDSRKYSSERWHGIPCDRYPDIAAMAFAFRDALGMVDSAVTSSHHGQVAVVFTVPVR